MATPTVPTSSQSPWVDAPRDFASRARVTQLDIARVAGVHNTTVSLALRNSPTIPEATRQRIQALAENMGYCPDPALRALNAYRNGRRPPEKIDTIGYITNWNTKLGWQTSPAYLRYHAGAARKASQLGFQLEHFWLGEAGMSGERLATVLFHRRINGAIFASHPGEHPLTDIGWGRICAVKIGRFPSALGLHCVAADHAGAVHLAVHESVVRGYRRIGLVLPPSWDRLSGGALGASFLNEQRAWPLSERVPVLQQEFDLSLPGSQSINAASSETPLRTWMLRHRPEVVIGFSSLVAESLGQLGYSVPNDVGFIELSVTENGSDFSSVRQHCEHVGAIAVEKLVTLMQQNLSGVPRVSTATLVDPSWIEGASLPFRAHLLETQAANSLKESCVI